MLRIAAGPHGEPGVDVQYCAAGRGAYLCRTQACLERAFTRRALERALKLKNSVGAGLKAELEKQLILDKEFSGTQGKA